MNGPIRISRLSLVMFPLVISHLSFSPLARCAEDVPALQKAEDVPVEVVADSISYDKRLHKVVGRGNVVVTYKDVKLQADRAEVSTDNKAVVAEGHVTVFDGESTLSGDRAEYNFERRTGSFPRGTGYQYPWYTSGETIDQVSKDEIRVSQGSATTCNLERPHYDVVSKNVVVYPNDKIVLKNSYLRILGKKVLWIPYLAIPLDERESPFEMKTGYSDNFGFYLFLAKGFSLHKNVKLKGHFDFRTKRGVAGGADLGYNIPNFGRGKVVTYLVDDKRAPTPGALNPFSERREDTRYRLSVRHRTDFDPDTHAIVNWHELSDEFLIQEFFQREDRRESRPRSQVVVDRSRDDYGMFAEVVSRTNKFFSEIEKLPRLNFTWKNQPLFDTKFLYKHETEFANFQKRTARQSLEEDVIRVDTTHELQRPMQFLDARIKATPYANLREALYTKNRSGGDNFVRTLIGYGLETRSRYQKVFDLSSNFLGLEINKLRHISEPIVRYDAIRVDTDSPGELFQMDEFDALHAHDVFTIEWDHRLQTKRLRDGVLQRVDLVSYNTFVNYELNGGRQGGSSLTDWGHQLTVRPYDWLLFDMDAVFDFSTRDFRQTLFDVVLEPIHDRIRLVLSQGYLSEKEGLPGSHILSYDLVVKLNERWKVGGYMRTEFDTGNVEEWELRAIRDLHDFLLTFGVNVRDTDFRAEGTNKEAYVEFTMKAFPALSVGVGSRSSFVRPRIGRYYGGSNAEESLPSGHYGAF